jgi:nucleoside-triphosphatase THEP1
MRQLRHLQQLAAMTTDAPAPLAAILYTPQDPVEDLMLDVAHELSTRGIRLGGVLQHDIGMDIDDPCAMELENLASGERFSMSQELGRGSEACRLDPASLAHAAVAIRAAVSNGAQLVCVNKFGAQEALGSGLREEIGLAVAAGIPLLTAVGQRFLPEWEAFSGGYGELLPPDREAILDWCVRVCAD